MAFDPSKHPRDKRGRFITKKAAAEELTKRLPTFKGAKLAEAKRLIELLTGKPVAKSVKATATKKSAPAAKTTPATKTIAPKSAVKKTPTKEAVAAELTKRAESNPDPEKAKELKAAADTLTKSPEVSTGTGVIKVENISQPGEASKAYKDDLKSKTGNLTQSEKDALEYFTGGGYSDMRQADRDGGNDQQTKDFYSGYSKLPKYDGEMYRGLAGLDEVAIKKLLDSDTLTLDAMSSFSRSEQVAFDFAENRAGFAKDAGGHGVVLRIKSKTGRQVEHISEVPHEQEVFGGKGTTYKINKHFYADYGTGSKKLVIEAEEI